MKAQVYGYHSPDIDLDSFYPEDSKAFGFLLQVMIGPADSNSWESFDIFVCSSQYLENILKTKYIVLPRYYLFVYEYDLIKIKKFIEGYVTRQYGENWDELARGLSQLGKWEFESYN